LGQQERSENLDEAKDKWRAVHLQCKALKVELRLQRDKMLERQASIERQEVSLKKVHNVWLSYCFYGYIDGESQRENKET
jgi:hypothetical protein